MPPARVADNVEIIRRWVDDVTSYWERGEPLGEKLEQLFEPDVDYYPVRKFPGSKPCHGREEVRQFMDGYRDAWESVTWEVLEVTEVGEDRVLARCRLSGEGRGSGVRLGGEVFICYWLRHGRVFRQEDHLTEAGARRALGL